MEAVWPGERLDLSRTRTKESVATGFTRFQNGDVLVPKITPTFEAARAILVHGLQNGAGAGTTELHVLRPGPLLDPRFLLYLVNTRSFLKLGESEMYGVAGQQRVPDTFLRDLEVDLLPLDEQRRIADFLDAETSRIDRLREARVLQLQLLRERSEAKIAEEIDQQFNHYGKLALRRFTTSIEQGWSPQCDDVEADPDEWAVLKTSAVSSGSFRPNEHKKLPDGIDPNSRYQIYDGDILLTRGSGSPAHVGISALARTEGRRLLLSDLLYRVRLSAGWSPEFVHMALGSRPVRGLVSLLLRGQSGQTIKLRIEDVGAIEIPNVPFELQGGIAERLQRISRVTSAAESTIRRSNTLLDERRQALITAAVAGQFDVSTASGRNTTQGV
ncbi:hypothetical protein ACFYTF_05105 [Nocardia thailandica]|uniref:Type I restriction modification DNA specificity domain-containing protein n=1 Tax=Nocardia thailandica TaxID=257275 RepID=A0ABW6PIL3_9NOCA